MFLIVSELPLFRAYFARNWPLLSSGHGFVTLAIAMIVLGINVMGNLNKPSGSEEALGKSFWSIVIGSGILIFILGWINLVAVSIIFPPSIADHTDMHSRASSSETASRESQLELFALMVPLPYKRLLSPARVAQSRLRQLQCSPSPTSRTQSRHHQPRPATRFAS